MANLELTYRFADQLKNKYSEACDYLFDHSAIDTKWEVRQEAEERYNKALHRLVAWGLSPSTSYIEPKYRHDTG